MRTFSPCRRGATRRAEGLATNNIFRVSTREERKKDMKITNIYKKTAALFFLMAAALWPVVDAVGQVKGDKYTNDYNTMAVKHRPAKWHAMRSEGNFVDTFDDTQYFISGDGTTQIQATHTYVDTLYVKKGSSVKLWLPTLSRTKDENSAQYYQRWYNYLTEGTFATGLTGNDEVNDILTLHGMSPFYTIFYRFQNGYVAGDRALVNTRSFTSGADFYYPTDDVYAGYTGLKNGSAGNDYYIVGCDLSGYKDEDKTTFTEPTLGLRVLYYIVGIDDSWGTNKYANQYERLGTNSYQGGGNDTDSKYLEEYEITFPCDHLGNLTNELVSIARQAQFYRIPGDNTNNKLKATLVTGTDVLKLVNNGVQNQWSHEIYDTNKKNSDGTLTLGDESRAIFFRKNEGSNNAPWSVPDGTTATILVTKEVGSIIYNIARFKLTFKKEIRLLTQHQIARLDEARENNATIDENWFDKSQLYRTPAYLDENYTLLTSRTFDYDPNVFGAGETDEHQEEYYPYPLAWDFSSYLFYDGAREEYYESYSTGFPYYDANPGWGNYVIVKDYMGYGDKADRSFPDDGSLGGRNKNGYFLYVDASDLPGKLVTLPFTQNLCAGSELLVSAWVKSAGQVDVEDAAMLFSIYGIEYGPDGSKNRTLIHAQSTGQIRRTTHFQTAAGTEYTEENGYGEGQNDWYQVVLSFLNNDPNVANFDEYEVQIDNNCGSTAGGDFYLDEIKVYISKPLAEVTQLQTACSTGRTLMNLNLDWDRLMARVGGENTDTKHNLAICFVDTLTFHNEYDGTNIEDAINAAAVDLGQEGNSYHFRVLTYNTTFGQNNPYEANKDGGNLAVNNEDAFYGRTAPDGTRSLSVDFYGAMVPGRAYWVLLVPDVPDDDISQIEINGKNINIVKADVFSGFYGEPCAINADFKVTGDVIIKVNGQIVSPETEFCRGNINNFTVELQVPRGNGTGEMVTVPENSVFFDWFFGESREGQIADPQAQYVEENASFGNVTLQDALTIFRNLAPAATDLDSNLVGQKDENGNTFTLDMYELIDYYLNTASAPEGAQNRPLVLHRPSLNITLLDVMRVVICPIPMSVSEEVMKDLGYDEVAWKGNLCWGYTYLELTTTYAAPTVYPGFNTVAYPDDLTGQSLRIGLDQITSVNWGNVDNNTLTVDLRDAKSYKTTDPSNPNKDFTLQLIGGNVNPDQDYNKLYMTDTNDPDMKKFIEMQGASFDNHSLPIGVVKDFEAHYYTEGTTGEVNKMEVQFILDEQTVLINGQNESFTFVPREGYYYTFNVYFEEAAITGSATACYGRFPLTMKVVPEYLVWNDTQQKDLGETIGNWNNDENWQRIASTRIHAEKDDNSDYFTDGTNSTSNAFVPMLFSKVVIPTNSKIQLYQAGYGDNGKWNNEDRPAEVADPTPNIQYDLMAFESGSPLKTERYRVSLLDEIHFEPGAEMLHAEYLLYNKAWVDYQLDKGRWYTLASPLKAVVAGDFYTDKSGTEGNEYFKPIYYSESDNSRFNPSVYQRGWMGNVTLQTLNSGTKNVAISGNWSALYNDVAETYTPGTGFSLKVQDVTGNNATFRLPKADKEYYYYDNPTSATNETSISRNGTSSRLKSDELLDRRTDVSLSTSFTVELADAHGGYYLVGNPFMAHLDMAKFFNKNTSFAEMYWLVTEKGQEVAVGGSGDGLIRTGTGKIAPLQSFFVKLKTDKAGNLVEAPENITFTQDMQALGGTGDGLRSANALTITATTSDGRTSRAAVAYDMAASADYETSEDAELFLDSNLGDVPMVYTVAGTMATSINRTSELYNIPLGVYGSKQEMVTLSFGGLNQFSSATLYDAQEQTETPLREGKTVSVPAGTSGRYFLRAGTPTGNEVIARNAFLVYSVGGGKVMVTSSNTPLKDIRVYTMGGAQVRSIQASGMQQEIYLNRGIYLITVSDQDGLQETRKVLVR